MEKSLDRAVPLVHCPYCRGGLADPAEVLACAPCGARQHIECFRLHGRCATCGARDVLAHRKGFARVLTRLRLDATNFAITAVVAAVLSAIVTFAVTVDRNARASFANHKCPQAELSESAAALDRANRELAAAREELAKVIAAQPRIWSRRELCDPSARERVIEGEVRQELHEVTQAYRRVAEHAARKEYAEALRALPKNERKPIRVYEDDLVWTLEHAARRP